MALAEGKVKEALKQAKHKPTYDQAISWLKHQQDIAAEHYFANDSTELICAVKSFNNALYDKAIYQLTDEMKRQAIKH